MWKSGSVNDEIIPRIVRNINANKTGRETCSYQHPQNQRWKEGIGWSELNQRKHNGIFKGRICGNGSKQCNYLKEVETVESPNASLKALFKILIINAMEGKYTSVFEIPGVYLYEEMQKYKVVLLRIWDDFFWYYVLVEPRA